MVYVPRVFGFRIHKERQREVSTARQEAAEKMEQLTISKRKQVGGTVSGSGGGGTAVSVPPPASGSGKSKSTL
jgi:hypothetical protein